METLFTPGPPAEPLPERPHQKLYTEQAIAIATFLGGPLGGSYLLSLNYMLLGDEEAGQRTIKWGLTGTVLLLLVFFLLPEAIGEAVPNMVYNLAFTGLFYYMAKRLQGAYLAEHRQLHGRFMTRWRAVGVGLVSMVAAVLVAVSITAFLPAEEENKLKFGSAGHAIYFDGETVTADEARKVANLLADIDLLGEYQRREVLVEQSKWAYKVLLPASEEDFTNSSILGYYRLVQADLDSSGFEKRVQLMMFYMEGEARKIKIIE
ncbi:hypothetical protein GCM10023188_41550 [Pontibacter saemangeumensis]|uniref:Uncharacterized protein n=1 Tax=Pontibacter saemangeumensis TaxID=1084525 RepID=A0ABP8M2U4_9BACT